MINDLIKLGKKNNIDLEVQIQKYQMKRIKIFNYEVDDFKISDNISYDIKSLYKGKYLTNSFSNINNSEEIIDIIIKNSNISENEDASEFAKQIDLENKILKNYDIDLNIVKEYLLGLNKLKNKYKFIYSIESGFSFVVSENIIVNESVNLQDINRAVGIYAEFVIKKGDKVETVSVDDYNSKFDPEKFDNKIKEKLEDEYKKLDSVVPESNTTKILLTNEAMYSILSCFLDMFDARRIRLKISPLVDKLNTKIFSDKITIVEEPSNTKMITSHLFDGEGTKTYYKEIVKNGVFKTILYNNKEAILAKMVSTGNSEGVTNCYIVPGEKTFNEMIELVGNGIIIDRVDGINSGIEALTGEISLQSRGYIVVDGKKEKAIKMFVMTTNIFELLSNVIEVGNDLEFFDEDGGSPSILIDNINISGK